MYEFGIAGPAMLLLVLLTLRLSLDAKVSTLRSHTRSTRHLCAGQRIGRKVGGQVGARDIHRHLCRHIYLYRNTTHTTKFRYLALHHISPHKFISSIFHVPS